MIVAAVGSTSGQKLAAEDRVHDGGRAGGDRDRRGVADHLERSLAGEDVDEEPRRRRHAGHRAGRHEDDAGDHGDVRGGKLGVRLDADGTDREDEGGQEEEAQVLRADTSVQRVAHPKRHVRRGEEDGDRDKELRGARKWLHRMPFAPRRPSLAPKAPEKGVSRASARAQPPFDEQDRGEDPGDHEELAGPAAVDGRPDDEEEQRRDQHDPDHDLEQEARAQADGGSGSPAPQIGGLAAHPSQRPRDRVVRARHDALLERDDRVVGDVDVLGTDVRAALGDVAVAEPVLQSREVDAVVRVERMHLERREPHEVPRSRERRLVLLVVADDMADVLAQEALDALVEFLHALDVLLVHPPRAVGFLRLRLERGDRLRLLVVVGDVGDEILDDRERLHRRDGDLLARLEGVHPRHAHELRVAVDLGAARAALARLAVPAHGEIGRVRRLDAVHDVEDDHALIGRHAVIDELPAGAVAAPDLHADVGHVYSFALAAATGSSATLPVGLSSPMSGRSSAGTVGQRLGLQLEPARRAGARRRSSFPIRDRASGSRRACDRRGSPRAAARTSRSPPRRSAA